MNLDILENKILKVIESSFPFDFDTVKKVYEEKDSFDKTIAALKAAVITAEAIETIIKKYKNVSLPLPNFPSGGIVNSGGEENEVIITRKTPTFTPKKLGANFELSPGFIKVMQAQDEVRKWFYKRSKETSDQFLEELKNKIENKI